MALAFVLASAVAIIPLARAQGIDEKLWIPNGTVRTLAIDGNILYLGGEFTQLSPPPGSDLSLAPVSRIGVAAIDLNTGVPTDWAPSFTSAYVRKVVAAESTVYLAGLFNLSGGQSRYLIELSKLSGESTEWNPIVDNSVFDFALTDSTVLIGGLFDLIGGQRRWYVGEVRRSTGLPTSWGEGLPGDAFNIMQLCLHGDVVHSGGYFGDVHAFDAHTGVELPAPAYTGNGPIWTLAAGDGVMYVGGGGSGGGDIPRLAAFDLVTGQRTGWQPYPRYGPVRALALAPDRMYVGGEFYYFGDYEKRYLAAVDLETGALLPTDIGLNWGAADGVYSIALHGRHVYAGGHFTTAADPSRANLVGFEEPTVVGVGAEPKSQAWRLSVRPNPLAQHGNVHLTLPRSETVSLSVYDIAGRERARMMEERRIEAGPHEFPLSAKRLEPGVYFVRLRAGDRRQSTPFVVRQ